MANSKSALKRVKIAERNRLRNKTYKSAVRTLTKNYLAAVEAYSATPTDETIGEVNKTMATVYSKIDKAVKRGVYHRNKGARKKSQLARALKEVTAQAS